MSPNPSTETIRRAGLGYLFSEAIRNRLARIGLTLTVLTTCVTSVLVVYVTERDAVHSNATYTSSMLRDGYATLLIEQPDKPLEEFTWADCNTLRYLKGVRAVVALREPLEVRLWGAGGPTMPLREAMGDVVNYLAATSPDHAQRWISPSLIFDLDALAARPPSDTTGEFEITVVGEFGEANTRTAIAASLTSLGGGFSGNALALAPPKGKISTCVVLSDFDKREPVELSIAGLLPIDDGFSQRWALTNAERFDSPRQRYENRPSRWYWLAALTLITILWVFSLWIIRTDLAVFAVAGLGTRRLTTLAIAEMLIVALAVGLIVISVAVFEVLSHGNSNNAVGIGLRAVSRTAIAAIGVGTVIATATTISISRRTIDALKDR